MPGAGHGGGAVTGVAVPRLEPMPWAQRYRLVREWVFYVDTHQFVIPPGYVYDGASVPRGGWYTTYSPFNPIVMVAALEHDWLCERRPAEVSSARAAEHFRDRLVHAGAVRRQLMYRAVLHFGPKWAAAGN